MRGIGVHLSSEATLDVNVERLCAWIVCTRHQHWTLDPLKVIYSRVINESIRRDKQHRDPMQKSDAAQKLKKILDFSSSSSHIMNSPALPKAQISSQCSAQSHHTPL